MFKNVYKTFGQTPLNLLFIGSVNLLCIFSLVAYVNEITPGILISSKKFVQDTPSYIAGMEAMREYIVNGSLPENLENIVYVRLLTTPFFLGSALLVGEVFNDLATGMILLNVGFYFASILIFYRISFLVFLQERTAFIATLLYIFSWGLASFGITYLSDMGGWFFFLLITMLALEYYRDTTKRLFLFCSLLAAIVGVLFKEYAGTAMLSLVILILVAPALSMKRRLFEVFLVSSIFWTCLLLWQVWFYLKFNYSYLDWFSFNFKNHGLATSETPMRDLGTFIKVMAVIFLPGWPFFLLGTYRLVKNLVMVHYRNFIPLFALLPAALTFLLWPAFLHRIAYIFVPWAILVSAYGLNIIRSGTILGVVVIMYIVLNYSIDFIIANVNPPF